MINSQKISKELKPVRVVNILTSSLSVPFLEGQPEFLEEKGFEVILISSPGEELARAQCNGVQTVAVPIAREISPWRDWHSLWRLVRTISRLRPTITNVATPKAGLLGGIAAWVCRIPVRYYTLHGLRCETTTGLKRQLLLITERIACLCAHRVICVSESLRRKAIYLGLVDAQRTVVLASGSCAGVDAERFAPTAEVLRRAAQLRHDLGIFPEAPVVGFVGRLTRDKGVSELIEAYLDLRTHFPELRLLLVGHMEKGDPLPSKIRRRIESEPGIIHTGFVRNPVLYYHVMDVVALPTYREGFGNTAIEANAAGKSVVAARSTGVVDAVIDGVTGILVPVGDVVALVRSLKRVLNDKDLAASMGRAGRERVLREFRRERVWGEMVKEYLTLLHEKGLWLPEKSTRASISNLVSDREAIGS